MEREEILKLSGEINYSDLEKARKDLDKKYEISYGRYEAHELKKAISEKNPVIIKEHFLIGYDPDGQFVDINSVKVPVEKMVKAVIVEGIKEVQSEATESRDPFIIYGKNEWEDSIDGFAAVFNKLYVGDVFLPPHSAIVNFLKPDGDIKKNVVARKWHIDCIRMMGRINSMLYFISGRERPRISYQEWHNRQKAESAFKRSQRNHRYYQRRKKVGVG